jgi:hypothetical protein
LLFNILIKEICFNIVAGIDPKAKKTNSIPAMSLPLNIIRNNLNKKLLNEIEIDEIYFNSKKLVKKKFLTLILSNLNLFSL